MKTFACILSAFIFIYLFYYLVIFILIKRRSSVVTVVNETQTSEPTEEAMVPSRGRFRNYISLLIEGWIRYRLIRLGHIPCHTYRDFILKHIYRLDMGEGTVIYGGFEIRSPWNIHIGRGTIIGDNSILDGRCGLYIGDNVNLSTGVNVWTLQHDVNDPMFACKGEAVRIGSRAWISNRTIILPGVKIGEGAVIAAGAVVTKDCEEFSIYGGIPAKKIGERNRNLQYNFGGNFLPFY